MTDRIFVDTAAFIALADCSDACHLKAKQAAQRFADGSRLMTSEAVLVETFSNLSYHLGAGAARTFSRSVLLGEAGVDLIAAGREDLLGAQRILDKYDDQKFSFVDALSFSLMERLKISKAFTFDKHFKIFRASLGKLHVLPS